VQCIGILPEELLLSNSAIILGSKKKNTTVNLWGGNGITVASSMGFAVALVVALHQRL